MGKEQDARRRAEVILGVRSGQISASQGARLLGISRKTYYRWERRALRAMMEGLGQGKPGRPPRRADPGMRALREKIARLEARLSVAEQTAEVRAILLDMRRAQGRRGTKKKKSR